jgi:two-component system sensor histidine kinase KdpD
MGIGLSICKTIITAHNGTITAQNKKDGCQFLFTLPRQQNER